MDGERTNLNPSGSTARTLELALEGRELDVPQIASLFSSPIGDLPAIVACADTLRRQQVGDVVTYVVNRNINFTNVCIKRCGFCAFSRTSHSREGYFLPIDEIIRRAREARDFGATEVCIQAGLPPGLDGGFYVRLCKAVKDAVPDLHLHAFSPEEVLYGCQQSGWSVLDHLRRLQDAGVGSLPGTSAEILDDEVREILSPGRITPADWIKVISTAHRLGIPTTSTIMYGHVETGRHCAEHLTLLRDLQKSTGGFTEFVPLSFVHREAPIWLEGRVPNVRPGASGPEVLKMHAIARIVLGKMIPNVQVSWVKEGLKLAQLCLAAGANDFGGTLMNESISTAAGAEFGQRLSPRAMRGCIREAGRVPCERSTTYKQLRQFDAEADTLEPLDLVAENDINRFGSYHALTQATAFRYSVRNRVEGR